MTPIPARRARSRVSARAFTGWLLAAAWLGAPDALAADSDEARLERGEVLVHMRAVADSDVPLLVGRGVIDVPPARLWAFVEDCRRYAGKLPRVVRSRQLSREGPVAVCETTSKLPFPLGEMTSVTRAVHEVGAGRWSRRWTLISGDYDRNSGAWILTPFGPTGQRTLLTYEAHAEPKTAVPAWLLRQAQKRGMPDLFGRLREVIVAGSAP